MNKPEQSSGREITRRAEQALAERSTTLIARGLADLQRRVHCAETLALITAGNIFEAVLREDIEAVRQILVADPTKAHAQLGVEDAVKYHESSSIPKEFFFKALDTPLHVAAAFGFVRIAQALIDAGASVNASYNGGMTPLHQAVRSTSEGASEVISVLLGAGADVNVFGGGTYIDGVWYGSRTTPLYDCREVHTARQLVKHGADLNAGKEDDTTPLEHACNRNEIELAEFLIESGANPNERDSSGYTLLHTCGGTEVAQLLVAHGLSPVAINHKGLTPLHIAAQNGKAALSEFLISVGADPNSEDTFGQSPLHHVSQGGWLRLYCKFVVTDTWSPTDIGPFVKTAQVLLRHGADPNLRMHSTIAVLDSLVEPHWENVVATWKLTRAAISYGVATFSACVAFISDAVGEDNVQKIFEYLVDAWHMLTQGGEDNRDDNRTLILQLKAECETSGRKQERIKGAHRRTGDTPLHLAAARGDPALARALLDKGANPNLTNDLGMTPLQIAAIEEHGEVMKELLAAGAKEHGPRPKSSD